MQKIFLTALISAVLAVASPAMAKEQDNSLWAAVSKIVQDIMPGERGMEQESVEGEQFD